MSTNCNNLIKTPLVSVANISTASATVVSPHNRPHLQKQQQQQQQQQHPITTTKMGSRRIFSAQFKLQVLDSYRMDSDCKGNQRATARKYGIHRRQIQKWLQNETNLRSSVNNNNNNNSNSTTINSNDSQNNLNNNASGCSNTATTTNASHLNKMSAMHAANGTTLSTIRPANNLSLSGVDNANHTTHLHHENGSTTATVTHKSILSQSAFAATTPSAVAAVNFHHFTKTATTHANHHQLHHHTIDANAMSLDMSRHSVAASVRSNGASQLEHGKSASEYKCDANASSANDANLAASYVARPVPHLVGDDSYAQRQQPIRIVPTSYLMAARQPTPATPLHSNGTAFSPVYPPAHHPFDVSPLMYDVQASGMGMLHPSLRHYMPGHEHLSMAMGASFVRPMPTAFENSFHLASPSPSTFYGQQTAYEQLYGASYLASLPTPISHPTDPVATTTIPRTSNDVKVAERIECDRQSAAKQERDTQSPIDLTNPIKIEDSESRMSKPRFPLPMPPIQCTYKAHDIPRATANVGAPSKPLDLRYSLKRRINHDDIDEGISEPEKSAASPTPAKVVKLFKPYLLSSDDEDDDGKNSTKSDEKQKDPIIWSSHAAYENGVAIMPFQSSTCLAPAHSPQTDSHPNNASIHSSHSSYWLNHGSPVSGYDSASSTFSDCNCNDAQCQAKLASPAPTVASTFSDDFAVTPLNSSGNSSTESHRETVVEHIVPATTTKYMIPRRHIMEKWSHEDEVINQQFSQIAAR